MRLLALLLISLLLFACVPAPLTTLLPGDKPSHTPAGSATAAPTETPTATVLSTSTVSVPTLLPHPYQPRQGDAKLMQGSVFLESVDVISEKGDPPQYVLYLQGSLPTPCHELRIQVQPPDAAGNVYIEVYSVADAQTMCIQVLHPFSVQLPFLSGAGTYTFWVNGKKVE